MNSKILVSLFVVAFMASCSENEMQFPNDSKPKSPEKTEQKVEKAAVAFASSLSESAIATKAGYETLYEQKLKYASFTYPSEKYW